MELPEDNDIGMVEWWIEKEMSEWRDGEEKKIDYHISSSS